MLLFLFLLLQISSFGASSLLRDFIFTTVPVLNLLNWPVNIPT
jgi:hypothetical protein